MDTDAEMLARHSRMLADFATWAHDLAGELHAEAKAAETPAERATLTRAFHEVSRSARQSMALELRLRRETRRLDRETQDIERPRRHALVERKRDLREALHDLVWAEYEIEVDPESEALIDRLMEEAFADPEAAEVPIAWLRDQLEDRLCEDLEQLIAARRARAGAAKPRGKRAAEHPVTAPPRASPPPAPSGPS